LVDLLIHFFQQNSENPKPSNLNLDSMIVDLDKYDKKSKQTIKKRKQSDNDDQDDEDDDDDDDFGELNFRNSEMQSYLRDAFMDDDVIDDFMKEKRAKAREEAEASAGPAKQYLPGWGTWAGAGIRETKRKKQRQFKRTRKQESRLDSKISNAIILNNIDEIGAKFKVYIEPLPIFCI